MTRVTEFDARINLDEVARVSNIVSVFRQHSRLIIDVINQFIQRSLSLFSIPSLSDASKKFKYFDNYFVLSIDPPNRHRPFSQFLKDKGGEKKFLSLRLTRNANDLPPRNKRRKLLFLPRKSSLRRRCLISLRTTRFNHVRR